MEVNAAAADGAAALSVRDRDGVGLDVDHAAAIHDPDTIVQDLYPFAGQRIVPDDETVLRGELQKVRGSFGSFGCILLCLICGGVIGILRRFHPVSSLIAAGLAGGLAAQDITAVALHPNIAYIIGRGGCYAKAAHLAVRSGLRGGRICQSLGNAGIPDDGPAVGASIQHPAVAQTGELVVIQIADVLLFGGAGRPVFCRLVCSGGRAGIEPAGDVIIDLVLQISHLHDSIRKPLGDIR